MKSIWYDEAEDCIWLGLHLGGINKLDIKTGRFTVYRKREGDKETIPSDIVRDIVPYKDSLVVATRLVSACFPGLPENVASCS